ncbi:MAG TPA: hypothetical protein VNN77_06090 [candidate division Zixibacteria bacterium]|nr:hypothetical protein [candidate division Zixibacteria bacterium]
MIGRLTAACLCLLIVHAGAAASYAVLLEYRASPALHFGSSIFSVDPVDDFADPGYPEGVAANALQSRAIFKLALGVKVKKVQLREPARSTFQRSSASSSAAGELYQQQRVLRI